MRERYRMPDAEGLVTAEELEKLPDDDYRYELVEGRVVRMSPVEYRHGKIVMRFGFLLGRHLHDSALGVVLTEVGFKLKSRPDTVRAPDVAFIRQERIPTPDPRGFWNGPPDLAVEVLSPDERGSEIERKIDEYLTHGVPVALVVDPDAQTVDVFRPGVQPLTLTGDATLDLSDVIVGFRCRVREIFE